MCWFARLVFVMFVFSGLDGLGLCFVGLECLWVGI